MVTAHTLESSQEAILVECSDKSPSLQEGDLGGDVKM